MSSTRITRHVDAPSANVYRALLDARAVANWVVLTGMTSRVHAFDAREGGSFRVSLTYDKPTGTGKTSREHRHVPRPLPNPAKPEPNRSLL
jgi:uncharacterized protein YndB with AHSA1/START domain